MAGIGARIGPDTVFCRSTDHVETQVAGQTLMMSIARSRYFALEATGQRIWECLAEPVSIARIVGRLVEEYDVEPGECERDVTAFVGELMENGLAKNCTG